MYIPSAPLGLKDKSFQGEGFFAAPNPPFGAVFTYYLKDEIQSKKKKRQEAEKELVKKGADVAYPSWEDLRTEDREEDPAILLTVSDEEGNVVRTLTGPVTAGFNRVAWDLRYPPATPTELKPPKDEDPFAEPPRGPLAAPGPYKVSLAKRVDGKITPLSEALPFDAVPLGNATLAAKDREALLAFEQKTARLQRAVQGAVRSADEASERLDYLKKALLDTPAADPRLGEEARALAGRLKDLQESLTGDPVKAKRNEPVPPSIQDRVQQVVSGHWSATSEATQTHLRNYEIAASQFAPVLEQLRALITVDLKRLEAEAEAAGAPWTPGRVPEWRPE
jgi:hypothetical protein